MSNNRSENSTESTAKRLMGILLIIVILGVAFALWIRHLNQLDIARAVTADAFEEQTVESYGEEIEEDVNLIRYEGAWYRQNPDLDITLIIGADVKTYDQAPTKQGDLLLLVAMDTKHNRYQPLMINRDTMAEIPQLDMYEEEYGTKTQQIALAYAQGKYESANCRNTVKAVSNLLYGLDIDHYVSVTMDAVPIVNDLVDGVPVYVEDDFSQVDPEIKQGETVLLRGAQALTFVRARGEMEEPTNLARMERQRVYMRSLEQRAVEKAHDDQDFVIDSLLEVANYFTSDCTINKLSDMLNLMLSATPTDIQTIKGEARIGTEYMEYHVDEEALQKQIIELFYVQDKEY